MKLLGVTTFFATIAAALLLIGVVMLTNSHNANAVAPDIASLSVDTNTAGNGSTAATSTTFGTIDECRSFASNTGQIFTVDVIVQTVPSPGMASYGVSMVYDPNVLQVTGTLLNDRLLLANNPASGPNYFLTTESPPGLPFGSLEEFTDSNVDLSTGYDIGAGVLFRLTFQVVGTGHSALDISQNPLLNGNPQILGKGTSHAGKYTIGSKVGGDIYVGQSCPPVTATLTVSKAYVPTGNTAITATPSCTTGTSSPLSQLITPGTPFQFTITGFTAGATCSVSETGAPGYTPTGCQGINMTNAIDSPCTITNTLNSATFTVNKDFSDKTAGDTTTVSVTLNCGGVGTIVTNPTDASEAVPAVFTVTGIPSSASCTATEGTAPSGYTSSGCTVGVTLSANGSASCTILNTLNSATLMVTKVYSDGSNTAITATPTCTNGGVASPLFNSVDPTHSFQFSITGFTVGDTCSVSESGAPAGYVQTGCQGVVMTVGAHSCVITNNATATLKVTKTYSDTTTTPVMVTPSCTTGTIISPAPPQSVPTGATGFTFNLSALPASASCTVSETGGQAGYAEDLPTSTCDDAQSVSAGGAATCNIRNVPSTTTFTVNKDFSDKPSNDTTTVTITLTCTGTAVISGGAPPHQAPASEATPATFTVTAFTSGNTCSATEGSAPAGYAKNETACQTVRLIQTTTPACTITNTTSHVFNVAKNFDPDNASASATMSISCSPTGGTALPATASASEAAPASFTVTGFTGDPTCTATESPVPSGYSSDSPCSALLSVGTCMITNTLRDATFNVTKAYSPSGPDTQVSVTITCNTASPHPNLAIDAAADVKPSTSPIAFHVKGFNVDDTCTATESVPGGYTASYSNCVDQTVVDGGTPIDCHITNTLNATFTVTKDFVPNASASVSIFLSCGDGTVTTTPLGRNGDGDVVFTVTGIDTNTSCTATEPTTPSGYTKSEAGCVSISLTASGTASCTITNTLRSATLTVTKTYSDATTTAVTVTLTCTSGSVNGGGLSGSASASPTTPASFTVTGFNGSATCSIAESGGASGYAEDGTNGADTCHSGVSLVANGTPPSCNIVNSPSTTTFTVSKHFVPSNAGSVTVTLACNGGTVSGGNITANSELASEATPATFTVTAFTSGNTCTASESGAPAGYVGSGCVNVLLVQGATSCTLTNTIPPTPTPTPLTTPTPVPTIHHDTATPSPTPTLVPTATPSPTPTLVPTATPSPTPFTLHLKWGDSDCSGDVAPRDGQAILEHFLNKTELSQSQPCPSMGETVMIDGHVQHWGDFDCSGAVAPRDAQADLSFFLSNPALSQTPPCPVIGSDVDVQLIGP